MLPAATVLRRKVTSGGVIWLGGRAYYITRRLSGQTVAACVHGGRLVVEAMLPFRKEHVLVRRPPGQSLRAPARGWQGGEAQ